MIHEEIAKGLVAEHEREQPQDSRQHAGGYRIMAGILIVFP
jgi:hypothetical protein